MGRIQSSTGLITGVDIASTVDQLIKISAQPRDRLQNRVKGLQTQQVAVNELTALLVGVQLQATRLGTASNLASINVASSQSDVLKATASGSPATGTYTLQSVQTAQSAAATSNAFSSASDLLTTGQLVVQTGGFVDGTAKLDTLQGGNGVANGRIRIVDRGGVTSEVDLRFATSVEDVAKAINRSTNMRVSAKISGDRLVLTDLTGQTTSNLQVLEVGEGRTAADLGLANINVASSSATGQDLTKLASTSRLSDLRDGRGIAFAKGQDLSLTFSDGTALNIDVDATSKPATMGQLITAINAANSSKLEAKISDDGKSVVLVDKTAGSATFTASGKLAEQLGLANTTASSGTITGSRIASALSGPLLSSLNGGSGIGTPGSIAITNRAGTTTSVSLSGVQSLQGVIDAINSAGAGVTATLNRQRTGILIQDVTGATASNLTIVDNDANTTATKLKIAQSVASNTLDSGSLNRQYVSETTLLSDLNQGRGVRAGTIDFINTLGEKRSIDVGTLTDKTVGGMIAAINATGIGIQASLNANGDGIVITDATNGAGSLTITDRTGSLAAKDLGIAGSGVSKVVAGNNVQQIEGSQTFRLDFDSAPTLSELVKKINESGGPLTASLLVTGATTRIAFNSRASGAIGRMVVDGSDLGFESNTTTLGRDAIVAINPSEDAGGTIVRASSNNITNAIDGLTINVVASDDSPVELQVTNDNSNIQKNLQLFVDQFNKVRDRIESLTSFDPSTGTTGVLFGANEVLRAEQNMSRMIGQSIFVTGSSIRSIEQLGLTIDSTGKLRMDSTKLNAAIEKDPEAVKSFFTDAQKGFATKSKALLENLVGVNNGVLVARNESLQRRIEDGNRRIEFLSAKLDAERTRLELQFYRMEETISKIRGNTSSLTTLQALAAQTSS